MVNVSIYIPVPWIPWDMICISHSSWPAEDGFCNREEDETLKLRLDHFLTSQLLLFGFISQGFSVLKKIDLKHAPQTNSLFFGGFDVFFGCKHMFFGFVCYRKCTWKTIVTCTGEDDGRPIKLYPKIFNVENVGWYCWWFRNPAITTWDDVKTL